MLIKYGLNVLYCISILKIQREHSGLLVSYKSWNLIYQEQSSGLVIGSFFLQEDVQWDLTLELWFKSKTRDIAAKYPTFWVERAMGYVARPPLRMWSVKVWLAIQPHHHDQSSTLVNKKEKLGERNLSKSRDSFLPWRRENPQKNWDWGYLARGYHPPARLCLARACWSAPSFLTRTKRKKKEIKSAVKEWL